MSLREELMRYFDEPSITVGLLRDGTELAAPGYERQSLPRTDGRIEGRVVFGPFPKLTRLNEVVLFEGDQVVESLYKLSEVLPLPPGAEFAHDMGIEVL